MVCYMICRRWRLQSPVVSDHGGCAPCDSAPDLGEPDDDHNQDILARMHAIRLAQ